MKKFIIFICSLSVLALTLVVPVSAQNYVSNVTLNCNADLMISLDDGSVIISKNADKQVAPASLTKIMTALVVLKNCPDLEKTMTVSDEAIESLVGTGSSLSGLKSGETMTFYNMLCCLLIPSGNDAAAALAVEVGGSFENFVEMMNKTATEIGCKNTHFDNPHGLDSATHKTTANDLAIMSQAALKYSAFEKIVSCATYKLPATNKNSERTLVNTNYLLNSSYITYYYKYCKGIKTGSTDDAGKCVVTYASKDGYKYLAIALGGDYRDTDKDGIEENQAFMDSINMYKWAFTNLSYEAVATEGQYVSSIPLNYCWSLDSMKLVAEDEVLSLVPTGNTSESVRFVPVNTPQSIDAPLVKGDYVCDADIMYAEQKIGTVRLVASEDADLSVLLYARGLLQRMTAKTVFKILAVLIVLIVLIYILIRLLTERHRRKNRELNIVKFNELERNTHKKKYRFKKETKKSIDDKTDETQEHPLDIPFESDEQVDSIIHSVGELNDDYLINADSEGISEQSESISQIEDYELQSEEDTDTEPDETE